MFILKYLKPFCVYACQVCLSYAVTYIHFSLYSYSHFLCNNSVISRFSIGKIPQAILGKGKTRKSKGLLHPLMKSVTNSK